MSTSISCPQLLKVDGPRWRQRTGQNQHPTVFPIKRRLAKQRGQTTKQRQTTQRAKRQRDFQFVLRLVRDVVALNLNLYVADRSGLRPRPQDQTQIQFQIQMQIQIRALRFGQSVIRTDRLTNWWPADWLIDGLPIDLWAIVGG